MPINISTWVSACVESGGIITSLFVNDEVSPLGGICYLEDRRDNTYYEIRNGVMMVDENGGAVKPPPDWHGKITDSAETGLSIDEPNDVIIGPDGFKFFTP